jgi:hypothetical protein
MSEDLSPEVPGTPILDELRRYARDNPLALVAGAAIIGMLLARFVFLGNPKPD